MRNGLDPMEVNEGRSDDPSAGWRFEDVRYINVLVILVSRRGVHVESVPGPIVWITAPFDP